MGAAMWFLNDLFGAHVAGPALERWLAMLALVTTGVLVYAAATFATGALRPADVKALLRRQG